MTANEIISYMESLYNDEQRRILMGFFKTGPGEYGEGDEFLGLKVPQTREVVKAVPKDFPLTEIPVLLNSRWHEVRLCGLLILVAKFERLATKRLENDEKAIRDRDAIVTFYLQYAERANNWDLVDLSVHKILGHWLLLPTNLGDRDYKIKVLDGLAQSENLWKQRMSIVCSWKTSQMGDPSWCLRYAEIHLHHPHDLMHKAVGWMLREMGKRVSMDLLRDFLRQHVFLRDGLASNQFIAHIAQSTVDGDIAINEVLNIPQISDNQWWTARGDIHPRTVGLGLREREDGRCGYLVRQETHQRAVDVEE